MTRVATARLRDRLPRPSGNRRLGQDPARVVHQVVTDRFEPVGDRGIATATRKMEATVGEFLQLTRIPHHPLPVGSEATERTECTRPRMPGRPVAFRSAPNAG